MLALRLNAIVRPSGETAGKKSRDSFVGGDVKLRVSSLSVLPPPTVGCPAGTHVRGIV
jgi:hypothetical protein